MQGSKKHRLARDNRRKLRAKEIFARSKFTGDYLESKVDYIARMIINDVVSEGKLFRDAYYKTCQFFCLSADEQIALQHSLLRHGWTSAYNDVGGVSGDNFNIINPYYIAPAEQYDY